MALPDSCCDFVMTRLMTFVLVPSSAFFSQLKIDTSSFFSCLPFTFANIGQCERQMQCKNKLILSQLGGLLT